MQINTVCLNKIYFIKGKIVYIQKNPFWEVSLFFSHNIQDLVFSSDLYKMNTNFNFLSRRLVDYYTFQ